MRQLRVRSPRRARKMSGMWGNRGQRWANSRFSSLRLTTIERAGMRDEREKRFAVCVIEKLENRWFLNGDLKGMVIDQTNGGAGISGITVYFDLNNNRI